jgi:MFS family permease
MGAVSVPKLNVILNLICRQYHFAPVAHNASPVLSIHSTIGEDNPECQTAKVHALLGRFMLYANLISGTLCAFSSPRLGALSDRYGRRLILAVTALGMLLGDIITITAASFPDSISVYWILVEFGFGGLAGSFIATMAVIQSYAADCTPPARRSVVFGYLHGCMFLGIAVGPVLGGLIIKASGNIMTIFYVAFVCHLGFIVFITSFVPESLSRDRQIAARERHRAESLKHPRRPWTTITNLANIFKPLSILFPSRDQTSDITRTNLVLLAAVDTVVFGVTLGSASIVVMYSEFMFKWGNFESSVFVSIANTCRVGMLVVVLPLVFRIFSHRVNRLGHGPAAKGGNSDKFDISIIRVAVFFDVLGYIGYAIVATGILFIASGVIASVGGIASPTLQSALTTHVAADKTGELLGAISLLHALSRIAAPAALNLVYSLTIGKASSAVFWCLAAVFGGAWAAAWGIRARERDTGRGEYGRI